MRKQFYESILEKVSSREALVFVKNRLDSLQKLPNSGIIAGQSVSSAVVEFLNLDNQINLVFNDVDRFKIISQEFYRKVGGSTEVFKKLEERDLSMSSIFDVEIMAEGYGHVYEYFEERQKILGSFKKGLLNTTYIRVDTISPLFEFNIKKVIERFDINSTQVGFDVEKSERLVFTKDFIDFIYTKQLKINNWNSPSHSIIRAIRKKEELGKNIFFDFEEANLISSAYIASINNAVKTKKMINDIQKQDKNHFNNVLFKWTKNLDFVASTPLSFGEKYKSDFEKLNMENLTNLKLDENGKYFKLLPKNNFYIDRFYEELNSLHASSLLDSIAFEKLSEEVIYGFNNVQEIEKGATLIRNGLTYSSLCTFLPDIYVSLKNTRKSTTKVIQKDLDKNINVALNGGKYTDEPEFAIFRGGIKPKLIKNFKNITPNDYEKYKKNVKFVFSNNGHTRLSWLFDKFDSIVELNMAFDNIRTIEKETEAFIGFLETSQDLRKKDVSFLAYDIDYSREVIRKYIGKISEPFFDRKIDFETEDYKVKELVSVAELVKEGKYMKHCVGGYGYSVKEGYSIILQFVPKNKNVERFTMELQPLKNRMFKANYKIIQARGKSNNGIDFNGSILEALEKIDSIYSIFPCQLHVFDNITEKDIEEMNKYELYSFKGKMFNKLKNTKVGSKLLKLSRMRIKFVEFDTYQTTFIEDKLPILHEFREVERILENERRRLQNALENRYRYQQPQACVVQDIPEIDIAEIGEEVENYIPF